VRIDSLPASATATATQPEAISSQPERPLIAREKQRTVLCLLLVLLTLVIYNAAGRNGFVNFDDSLYITNNPHVRAGLTWSTVKWALTSVDAANWHPLTWLSHALDCQLFKMNPAGHHYVTVLFHAVNTALLFLVLAGATGLTWPSFMVAALFALHPVNVESVAWASERKNVLSMLFFLLSLQAYGWYVRRESVKRYAVLAVLFALGLTAKPEIITLPFVLLLWDYWPLGRMFSTASSASLSGNLGESLDENQSCAAVPRSFSYLLLEKAPLLVLSAGSAVVTFLAQSKGDAVHRAPAWVRIGNVPVAYVRYLGKAFWPTKLAVMYPHPGRFLPGWKIAASAIVMLLLTAIILRFRNRRYLLMGWCWFLGTLVPVIGLVQVGLQSMADRYAYLSYIGLFIAVVWTVRDLALERKISAVWLAAPSALILLTLGMLCRQQVSYWRNSETLWKHALNVTEGNFTAHDALGRDLAGQGRMDEAAAEFEVTYRLHGYTAAEMIDIGVYEQTHGNAKDAINQYIRALDESTDATSRAVALTMLGSAYTQAGDFARAKMSYRYALRENPENSVAQVSSGLLAEHDGDYTAAVDRLSGAMKHAPTDTGYLLLAQALRRAGREKEANDAYAHAQQISHDFAKAQESAAQVMKSAGIQAD
jgi:protein O-mannosyl-transferase